MRVLHGKRRDFLWSMRWWRGEDPEVKMGMLSSLWKRQCSVIRYLVPLFAGVTLTFARLNPGGYDLQIYREMARLALEGNNPYAHRYADFPPLKMLLFTLVERVGAWHEFLITLAVLHLLVLLTFLVRRYKTDETAIWLGIVGSLAPGVFLVNWYQVFEDKVVYVILMLALLLLIPDFHLRGFTKATSVQGWKFGLLGLILGVLQAYGGGGDIPAPDTGILSF